MNQLCKVCGEPAAGFHFGAFTCEGCKSFFGRTYNNVSGISECKNGNRCEINKKNRTSCKACRLRKCLQVGMSKSGSRYGRRSNWFKIHCLLSAQAQNSSTTSTTTTSSTPPSTSLSYETSSSLNSTSYPESHVTNPISSSTSKDLSTNSSRPNANGMLYPNLSPNATRDQFLASLNRKLLNPNDIQLAEYFRAPNNNNNNNDSKSLYGSIRDFDGSLSNTKNDNDTRSCTGSLDSPTSEISNDESSTKYSSPPALSLLPPIPGSPLDFKPTSNNVASESPLFPFDNLTRDLLKLGYDPLRLWPMMIGHGNHFNPHSFNPYRFLFPHFSTFQNPPNGFPIPNPHQLFNSSPNNTSSSNNPNNTAMNNGNGGAGGGGTGATNNNLHPSKLFNVAAAAAAAAVAASPSPTSTKPKSTSPVAEIEKSKLKSPVTTPIPFINSSTSFLALAEKFKKQEDQDDEEEDEEKPIDLSSSSAVSNKLLDTKILVDANESEGEEEDDYDTNKKDNGSIDLTNSCESIICKEEGEHLSNYLYNNNNNNNNNNIDIVSDSIRNKRRASYHSDNASNESYHSSPKRERASTPLDLTASTKVL